MWHNAVSFAFEVRDVHERSVNVNRLGAALLGHRIEANQPSAALFFAREVPVEMHLITRTLVSGHVAVRATGAKGQTVSASVSAVEDLIGNAKASVTWQQESDGALSFRGAQPATFALAAVPCNLRPDGSFTLGLELRGHAYLDTPTGEDLELFTEHLPLVEEDGLLDIE